MLVCAQCTLIIDGVLFTSWQWLVDGSSFRCGGLTAFRLIAWHDVCAKMVQYGQLAFDCDRMQSSLLVFLGEILAFCEERAAC